MSYAVCAALVLAVGFASAIAHRHLPQATHLPMQWGFDGRPTSFAPRSVALTFTPCLALCVVGVVAVLSSQAVARCVTVAMLFLVIHLAYLWMVHRHLTQP